MLRKRIMCLGAVAWMVLGWTSAAQTSLVSLDSSGAQANGTSGRSQISPDGRFVAFQSTATNLDPAGDSNSVSDIFVRDRQSNQTRLVSVDSSGAQANGASYFPSISADGRYVVFQSSATNLVPGDVNGTSDIFVRDRQTQETKLVSADPSGTAGNGPSFVPSISADGRHVAFSSRATNLVAGGADTNGEEDVFVRDLQSAQTIRASVDSGGSQADRASFHPSISADGRFVAFSSFARNLVPNDTNGDADVFVRDFQSGQTHRVSLWDTGQQGKGYSSNPSISADGRYVAFHSKARNDTYQDPWIGFEVYVRDRTSNTTTRASVRSFAENVDGESGFPSISGDGRYVAFHSTAMTLVPDDRNGKPDVFVRDLKRRCTIRMSVDSAGAEANQSSERPAISADGRFVSFASSSTDLVSNDANGQADIFLRDRVPPVTGLTIRASVDSSGTPSNLENEFASISADGRAVAFHTEGRLVPSDDNDARDVYLRDLVGHQTSRVSVDSSGNQADGYSGFPSVSADGRYVSFTSSATNLVPSDTNDQTDVFLRDRQTGQTSLVSLAIGGASGNSGSSHSSISGDGRFVAFDSMASDLVLGDTPSTWDVFVRDRQSGQTTYVSVSSSGTKGNEASYKPSISADGRYVAFESSATNLVPSGDTNNTIDVFLRDRQTGQTTPVSVDSSEVQGNGYSHSPSISADGRYVAFASYATNLVPEDTNDMPDVFVRDRQTGQTERVSVHSLGTQGIGAVGDPSISADGRFVAFGGSEANLVWGDTNTWWDVFVRDRLLGQTNRVSVGPWGEQGDGNSSLPSISGDGRYVAFETRAWKMAPGQASALPEILVHDRVRSGFTTLCDPGLDGVIACPCSNPPAGAARGCNNSAATGGATLWASGFAYLTEDKLVFETIGQVPATLSFLVQGTSVVSSGVTDAQGALCAGGTLTTLYSKTAAGGSITAPDLASGDLRVSAASSSLGDPIQAGQSRWYCVRYRDATVLGGCPATSKFNVTQTARVDWSP